MLSASLTVQSGQSYHSSTEAKFWVNLVDRSAPVGGERSVATIIFMLSLQELSHVPFRCVDEINQGGFGTYVSAPVGWGTLRGHDSLHAVSTGAVPPSRTQEYNPNNSKSYSKFLDNS